MAIRTDFTAGEVLAAADLNDTFASKLNLAGGKILQIVRATDATSRTTTSTTLVDVTGMSVTITPQKSDSAIIVIASIFINTGVSATFMDINITDSSNNVLSGASPAMNSLDFFGSVQVIGYSTPATTSATTYKLRFRSSSGTTVTILNTNSAGQMYAIEVSA